MRVYQRPETQASPWTQPTQTPETRAYAVHAGSCSFPPFSHVLSSVAAGALAPQAARRLCEAQRTRTARSVS